MKFFFRGASNPLQLNEGYVKTNWTRVCTYWYFEQVELAIDGSNGWKVTGGLCWAVTRKPMASRLKLKHVPVQRMITHNVQVCEHWDMHMSLPDVDKLNELPMILPKVSFLRPTLSTSHTPSRVNRKLVRVVSPASQIASLTSRTPDICRMVAL